MNDVFVSYSRDDAAWAQKLRNDLVHPSRGLEVFLDTQIQGGEEWEKQLAVNLKNCRNLVLLWSDTHAAKSEWVKREAQLFRALMLIDEDEGIPTNRRILQVCLDGHNKEYDRWQLIDDVNDPAQFKHGAANVDPNRWQRMLDRLMAAVQVDDTSPQIHQLVLASTREQMSAFQPTAMLLDRGQLAPLLTQFGLTHPDYLEAYGPDRSDWRPFGSRENIVTILARLRSELIAAGAPRFRWKPVEKAFWDGSSSDPGVIQIVERLTNEPSVVVIDPLSLYDPKVFGRYLRFMNEEYLYKPYTCLVVLPPCSADAYWTVQTAVRQVTQEVYERFYRPVFDEKRVPLASFAALVTHPDDVRRLLAATLRRSRQDFKQWWSVVNASTS
jgi:hypothetical protein